MIDYDGLITFWTTQIRTAKDQCVGMSAMGHEVRLRSEIRKAEETVEALEQAKATISDLEFVNDELANTIKEQAEKIEKLKSENIRLVADNLQWRSGRQSPSSIKFDPWGGPTG